MKRIKIAVSFAAALVAISIPSQSLASPTVPPEITIRSQAASTTKARIVSANTAHGYKLVSATPQLLVFSKPYPSSIQNAPGVNPQLITRYRLTSSSEATRISATIGTKMVHDEHGESALLDLTSSIGAPELKAILQRIKNDTASSGPAAR